MIWYENSNLLLYSWRFQYTFLREDASDFANEIQLLTDSSTEIVDEPTTTATDSDLEKFRDDLQVVFKTYGRKIKISLHEIENELQCTVDVQQVQ